MELSTDGADDFSAVITLDRGQSFGGEMPLAASLTVFFERSLKMFNSHKFHQNGFFVFPSC